MSFSVPLAGSKGRTVEREFGGVLSNRAGAVHRFSRTIRLEPKSENVTSEPLVTFLEPVTLRPGKYSLTTVLSDTAAVEPHAAKVECDVPAIPTRDSFLVGPILARRAGKDVVVRSGTSQEQRQQASRPDTVGDWNSFDPLLDLYVYEPTDLVAMTLACVADDEPANRSNAVLRRFRSIDGRVIGTLDPVRVEPEGGSGIRCQTVVDVLPARSIDQGGEYLFEASFAPDTGRDPDWAGIRFSVGLPKQKGETTPAEKAATGP